MGYESSSTSSDCSFVDCNCSNCRLVAEQELQRDLRPRPPLSANRPKISQGPSRHYDVDVTGKKRFFEHLRPRDDEGISPRSNIERHARGQPRAYRSNQTTWKRNDDSDDEECCVAHRTQISDRRYAQYDPQLESEPSPRHGYRAKPYSEVRSQRCQAKPTPTVIRHSVQPPASKICSSRCCTEPVPKVRSYRYCAETEPDNRSPKYYRNRVHEIRCPRDAAPICEEPYRAHREKTFRHHAHGHREARSYQMAVEPLSRGGVRSIPDYRVESYIDQERRHRATPADVVNHPRRGYGEHPAALENFTNKYVDHSNRAEETDNRYQSRRYQRHHKAPAAPRTERIYEKKVQTQRYGKPLVSPRLEELHSRSTKYYSKKKYTSEDEPSPRLKVQRERDRSTYRYQSHKTTRSLASGKQRNKSHRRSDPDESLSPSPRQPQHISKRDEVARFPEPSYPPPLLQVETLKTKPKPDYDLPKPKPEPDFKQFSKPKPKTNQKPVTSKKMTQEELQELYDSLKREELLTPPSSKHSSMTRLRELKVVKEMVPKWNRAHKLFQEHEEATHPTFTTVKQKQIHQQSFNVELSATEKTGPQKPENAEISIAAEERHSPPDPEYHTSDGSSWATKSSAAKNTPATPPPTIEDGSGTEMEVIVRPPDRESRNQRLRKSKDKAALESDEDGYKTAIDSIPDIQKSERADQMSDSDAGSIKSVIISEKEYKCDVIKPETQERTGGTSAGGSIRSGSVKKEYKCPINEDITRNKKTVEFDTTTTRELKITKQGKSRSENPGRGSVAGNRGYHYNRKPKAGPASVPDGLHPLTPKRSLLTTNSIKENDRKSFEKQTNTNTTTTTTNTVKEKSFWESWWNKSSTNEPAPDSQEPPEVKPLSPPGSSFDSELDSADSSQFAMTLDRSGAGVDMKAEETLRRISVDYDEIVKGSGEPQSLNVQASKLQFNRSHSTLQRASQSDLAPIPEEPLYCPHCHKLIESGELANSIASHGLTWHGHCFVCSVCEKRLYLSNHAVHEGQLYCVNHFAEKIKAPLCQGCGQFILDKVYTQASGNRTWHKECFRCSRCGDPIVDAKFVALKSGKILCIPCHKIVYKRICETCGKLIKPTDRYVHLKSSGHYWHATSKCLKCAYCQQPLDGRQRVFFKHNKTYCNLACARQDVPNQEKVS